MTYYSHTMSEYIQPNQGSLFDKAIRLEELHQMGDPLARLDEVIDWSLFAPVLARLPKAEPKGLGGRPPFAPGLNILGHRVSIVSHTTYRWLQHSSNFSLHTKCAKNEVFRGALVYNMVRFEQIERLGLKNWRMA